MSRCSTRIFTFLALIALAVNVFVGAVARHIHSNAEICKITAKSAHPSGLEQNQPNGRKSLGKRISLTKARLHSFLIRIFSVKSILRTPSKPEPTLLSPLSLSKIPIPPSNNVTDHKPGYMTILPVYPHELPKFLSLSMMMFWIVFVFTLTRDTKDTLVVTNCGAEAIAFLKVYAVIPSAAAFMFAYSKAANALPPRTLFYLTLAPFFVFYALFGFVLYPLRNVLHPVSIAVPAGGLQYAVNLLRYWTFSLYFVVSELWGSAGIPLLFWSCANDIIQIDQAKRIYPLMSLIGNLGPILSGFTMASVGKFVSDRVKDEERAFEVSLKVLTVFMTIAGGFVAGLHWFVHRLSDRETEKAVVVVAATKSAVPVKAKGKKPTVSFVESLKVLAANTYLRDVAVLVLSYGLTIEFTEIIWKATVKRAFPTKSGYMQFMGHYSKMVGCSATVMMFIGSRIVSSLGWKAGAMMTPVMMGLLALPFFGAVIFGGLDSEKALLVAVYVGFLQNVLSKATKYAIFDPTKEMTYIPLDGDSKRKGKAAIDVLGARLGKSGAALAQQVLVVLFGSIISGAPLVALCFYVIIFAWMGAVQSLSGKFEEKSKAMQESKDKN